MGKVHLCKSCLDTESCDWYNAAPSVGMYECEKYVEKLDFGKHICDVCKTVDEKCPRGLKRDDRDVVVTQCSFFDEYKDSVGDSTTNFSSRFMPNVKFSIIGFEHDLLDANIQGYNWEYKYWFTDADGNLHPSPQLDYTALYFWKKIQLPEVSIYEAIPELVPEGMVYDKKSNSLVEVIGQESLYIDGQLKSKKVLTELDEPTEQELKDHAEKIRVKEKEKPRFMPNVKFKFQGSLYMTKPARLLPSNIDKSFNYNIILEDGETMQVLQNDEAFLKHPFKEVSIYEAIPELVPEGMVYDEDVKDIVKRNPHKIYNHPIEKEVLKYFVNDLGYGVNKSKPFLGGFTSLKDEALRKTKEKDTKPKSQFSSRFMPNLKVLKSEENVSSSKSVGVIYFDDGSFKEIERGFSSRFMPNVKFKIIPLRLESEQKLLNIISKDDYEKYIGFCTNAFGDIIYNAFETDELFDNYQSVHKEVSIYEAIPELVPEGMRYNKELDKLVPDILEDDTGASLGKNPLVTDMVKRASEVWAGLKSIDSKFWVFKQNLENKGIKLLSFDDIETDVAKEYCDGINLQDGIGQTSTSFENKYDRKIIGKDGRECVVDVYDVLKAFEVKCPTLQHLIKKALCARLRGHKDISTDLQDIIDSGVRAKELYEKDKSDN